MKILSCNIRDARADDGDNSWPYREAVCIEIIARQSADIICFQEMRELQLNDIAHSLLDYDYFGLPEETANKDLPNAIFFRRNHFTVIDSGGYYLSKTPQIAGSKSWQSAYIRLANWLLLEEKCSGKTIRITNTHLDNSSQLAREHQAQLVISDCKTVPAEIAQILTGDMNCSAENPVIQYILDNHWRDAHAAISNDDIPHFTYHAFQGLNTLAPGKNSGGKIDWLFLHGPIELVDAGIIREQINGKFPSDHFFLHASVNL